MAVIGRDGRVSPKKFVAECIADQLSHWNPETSGMTSLEVERVMEQVAKYKERISKLLREDIHDGPLAEEAEEETDDLLDDSIDAEFDFDDLDED